MIYKHWYDDNHGFSHRYTVQQKFVEADKEIAELRSQLKKILESGTWFYSSLEFEHHIDGCELAEDIQELLSRESK